MSKHRRTYTSDGYLTVPAGIKSVTLIGCGGGGGGGGGFHTTTSTNLWGTGGGGGGGATLCTSVVVVTPGTQYNIVIGTGGNFGADNTKGGAGGDTLFYQTGVGPDPLLAQFYGAEGGDAGKGTTDSTIFAFALGGQTFAAVGETNAYSSLWSIESSNNVLIRPQMEMQRGGAGAMTNDTSFISSGYGALFGGPAPFAIEKDARGGSPGGYGTDDSLYRGGGGGGGGGMGAFGLAGDGGGGNGGNGNNAGVGGDGGIGSNPQANTGSGAGGGGGAGFGSGGRGNAGTGGFGASGKLIIEWYT